jgi:hypothetical protein
MEPQNLTYSQAANYDQNPASHHHNYVGRKKDKEKIQTQYMLEVAIHNTEYLQRQSLPIK